MSLIYLPHCAVSISRGWGSLANPALPLVRQAGKEGEPCSLISGGLRSSYNPGAGVSGWRAAVSTCAYGRNGPSR